jgi:hypothetical protein
MSGTNTGSGSLGPTPDSFAFKADAKFGASMGTDAVRVMVAIAVTQQHSNAL